MRTLLLTSVIILWSFVLWAQDDYTPLKCKGTIPADFITLSKEKFLKDKASISRKDKHHVKKDKTAFYLYTNYKIDFLLRSGKVLFGDEVTNYVNQVGKYVLKDYPELKKKIRFYVVKSPEVNAFATYQGIIFVNLGLLAQVENEAELAYVLSHEIIHYKNKHVINDYLNTRDIIKGRGKYSKIDLTEKEHAYFTYSKANESEADSLGLLDFYMKTDYDINEVLNIFDVLLYSYLPIDEVPFDSTYFSDEFFQIPGKNFKKDLKPISAIEDYDDSKSTHPNIKNRRTRIRNIIANLDDVKKGKKYIISEATFKKTQKIARFEMSQLYLNYTAYDKSFYNTYILLQKYPNSVYLKKKMAYALYGISKFSNYQTLSDVITSSHKYEGDIQQIPYFFRKLRMYQRTALAIKYAWDQYETTKDNYFKTLATELMYDLFKFSEKKLSYFIKENINDDKKKKDFKKLSKEEYLKLSKYDKIKYDKKKAIYFKEHSDDTMWQFVFLKEYKNPDFATALKSAYDNAKADKDAEELAKKKRHRNKRHHKIRLGIDTITIVNPHYEFYSKGNIKYIKSEEKEQMFLTDITNNANAAKLTVNTLKYSSLDSTQTDEFNKISLFNSWLYEYLNQHSNDDEWEIIPSQQEYMQPLAKENRYYGVVGLITDVVNRPLQTKARWISSCIFLFPCPIAIYVLATKIRYTGYYFILFDIKEGRYVFQKTRTLKTKDYNYVLNMNLYDTFHQVKLKPKRKHKKN